MADGRIIYLQALKLIYSIQSYEIQKIYTTSSTFSNDGNGRGDLIGAGNSQGYKLITDYNNIVGSSQESWAGDFTYDVEPGYKDTANGDYSLLDASPMIGLGVAYWSDEDITAPTKDILGNARGSKPRSWSIREFFECSQCPPSCIWPICFCYY